MQKMDDIEKCAKTKSVLGVLGPIANQVVELKGRQCVVCDATTVMKLMKQCQALEASCALLVSRLESYAVRRKDDVLSSEVKKIKSQMNQVAVSLTDATRDLHRGDVGIRDNEEVWAEIVESTEHLLSTLTEVLLVWDRAQVRRVTETLEHLQQCLDHLEQTHSIQHLPDKFQAVVSASVDLLRLLEVRCGDLYRQAQQETVRVLALQYCHTLPLLASTCAATVTHPLSKHIRASRELVSSHLQMLLNDLHSHVGHGDVEYDMDEAGSFITCVDKVLELLLKSQDTSGSVSKCVGSFSERVKPLLEKVLRHGIAVAYFSSPDDNHIIMAMCENVLKQLKILVSLEQNETPDSVDVQISCDVLADSVELLEQKVNTALIRLIVQTFSAPMAPLQNLMEALSPEANTVDQKTLDTRIKDFDLHVDHIFQVGGFATACTTDVARVRLIQDSLLTLEWMEGCLVPSVVSAYKDPHPNACAHAHMLAEHWVVAVKQLWDCLDHIMDPSAFSMVSKHEVHCAWAQLKEHLYTQDVSWIRKQVTRVATLTSRILSLHGKNTFLTDPQVEDLQVAIKEMMKRAEAVFASPTDLSRHRSMIKRVQLVLTLLARLSNSFNENNLLSDEDLHYIEVNDKKGEDKQLKTELTNIDEQLLTSNIDDIRIDIATPVSLNLQKESVISQQSTIKGTSRNQQQKKPLKQSSKSTSRLGEVRTRVANFDMSDHHSRSIQAMANETLACETSIDITKFLSRSTNIMSSSVRASRRNYTLRVKEINLDMDRALLVKTIHPSHPSGDLKDDSPEVQAKTTTSDMNNIGVSYSKSSSIVARETFSSHSEELSKSTEVTCVSGLRLKEISNLIAQQETLNFPSQQNIDAELSGILENLTSVAGSLTTLTIPSFGQKRKCHWEQFENEEKENADRSVLHGIRLQNASFNPQFPEISEETTEVFDEKQPSLDQNDVIAIQDWNIRGIQDLTVWKDFTAILESKTPIKNDIFNFSSNFSSWQFPETSVSFSTFGKEASTSTSARSVNQSSKKVTNLSNITFPNQNMQIPLASLSRMRDASNPSPSSPDCSVSSSSASISTPQRLEDLHLVHQRLTSLRSSLK